MASQIAHIIYDDCFFRKLDENGVADLILPAEKINREEFILGSVLPDIRRVDDTIRRKDTHMYFPKINLDFSGISSFQAGWKFHLFCDMKREEILNKYNFYKLEDTADIFSLPSKILEDELVYDNYNNWEKVSLYFKNPPFHSVLASINEDTFRLWYAIVSRYIEQKPNNSTMRKFLIKQTNLDASVDSIIECVEKIRKNKKAVGILSKIKDEII